MAIWDKVKQGIDKAGKAAQDAFDEGKTRIEAYRAREQADKAAEALGYAVFRAFEAAGELDVEVRDRLMKSLQERDNVARALEKELADEAKKSPAADPATGAPATGGPEAAKAGGSATGPAPTEV